MIGSIAPLGPQSLFGSSLPSIASQGGSPASSGSVAGSFAAALSDAASNAVGTLRQAENLSIQALRGNADTREVVDAVMSAEQALQAAVAIRDKIVTAYLEISRMGI